MRTNPKILLLAEDPCSPACEFRLGQALRGLASDRDWQLRQLTFDAVTRPDVRWADVVVIRHANQPREADLMAWMVDQDIPVVYDIDALLTDPPEHLPASADLQAQAHWIRHMLGLASVVTAASPRLVAHLPLYARSIHLVPDHGPVDQTERARHDDSGRATLVIEATNRTDLSALCGALRVILADSGSSVDLLAGPEIADGLEEAGMPCRRWTPMSREARQHMLASLLNPIGLIPQDDTTFSICRSAAPYLELACAGIPSVCSARPPCADVIRPGHDGLLCTDDPQAWVGAIRQLMASGKDRLRIAKAAREKVEIYYNLARTRAIWESVLTPLINESRTQRRSVPVTELLEAVVTNYRQVRGAIRGWNHRRLESRGDRSAPDRRDPH
jgi:hypothetical protein